MVKSDYEKWVAVAASIEATDNPLKIPYDVALAEATGVAAYVDRYWEASGTRPGLSATRKRMAHAVADEIRALVRAIQQAQTDLLLLVDPVVTKHGERAREVIGELEAILAFLLDDGVEEPADQQLAALRDFHSQDGQRSSTLAQTLKDYATFAYKLRKRLVEADAGFEIKLIDEARSLADQLLAEPAPKDLGDETEQARVLRNRLLVLLMDRVGLVRRTAAYVFRKDPAVVREVTSVYERRRRTAARKAKDAEPEPAPVPVPAE
jgi:hypothetical protein